MNGQNASLSPELLEQIQELLSSCTPIQQAVLRLRFGMEDGTQHTVDETASILGISSNRVHLIEQHIFHPHRRLHKVKQIKDFYT